MTPTRHRPGLGPASVADIVGQLLLEFDNGWRWMLASSALPALVIVLLRTGTRESPRRLPKMGRIDKAIEVLTKVYVPQCTVADTEEAPSHVGVKEMLRSGHGKRMVFITLFWTCSIVPLFAVYAFGPAIMEAMHLCGKWPTSAPPPSIFLIGCLVAVALVDRMGRRPLILHSFLSSGLALLALGFVPGGIHLDHHGAVLVPLALTGRVSAPR